MTVLLAVWLHLAALAAAPPQVREEPHRLPGTEQVQVDLVLVDVVVRDRKDHPVSGLTRDDFEILVDRLAVDPADIESFEEICAEPRGAPSAAGAPAAATADRPATSQTTAPVIPRYIVIYLDFSQMTFSARRQSLKAAREFVTTGIDPSDRVMVMTYGRKLQLLQDFTSDPALLRPHFDKLLDDHTTLESDVFDEQQKLYDIANKPCDAAGGRCSSKRQLAQTYAQEEEIRARHSLATLTDLMPALAGIRGRKALVLFTDSLREEPGLQYVSLADSTPREAGIDIHEDLLRLTREANAAGVSLYTVHASGLDDSSTEEFRDARPDNATITPTVQTLEKSSTGSDPKKTYEAARTALDSALSIQTSMAAETGGHAVLRSNQLGDILASAQQDLSCYYLLGIRYAARGDGGRHSILVRLRKAADGASRGSMNVRYRPYYTDFSREERRDRLLTSAMEAPELFHRFEITTEAFALAPEQSQRRVLIKATLPIEALSLTPVSNAGLSGHAVVSGEIRPQSEPSRSECSFRHDVPVRIPRDEKRATRLVFETGCLLPPGTYELSIAVLDPATQEVGARRSSLVVPAASRRGSAIVGEVHLWTADPGAFLVTAGAAGIGIKDRAGERAFIPRAERRLSRGEPATLSFLLCPDKPAYPTSASPLRVRRSLLGAGDEEVAGFRDILLSEPPDEATGCYQIFNAIPPNTLGEGVYRFTITLSGPTLGDPVTREAALAVD